MAQTKTSKSNEAYFTRYKTQGLYSKNRRTRLERLLKLKPEDPQLTVALKNLGSYRRATPKAPFWSHTMIRTAMLYKLFTGRFNKEVFSPKPDVADAASRERNPQLFVQPKKRTEFSKRRISEFSLAARAHDKQGNLVWAS